MKPTESYDQLINRFTKRIAQLSSKLEELEEPYKEYVKILDDLQRLKGSLQVAEYLAYGKLPHDGNHGDMKDHRPQ